MLGDDVTITVEIDGDICTGHGRCYSLSPAHFEPDEIGQGQVVEPRVRGAAALEELQNAIRLCPEQAIRIRITD
jgi:ferredoxin